MIKETALTVDDFIYPLFVIYGQNKKIPVESMPGIFQFSVDMLKDEVKDVCSLGIPAVLLFGIPEHKDCSARSAFDKNGVIQQAVKAIKDICPDLLVITDVCLCEYTDHGHCGIIDKDKYVDNDRSLELLAMQAISHVQAGCDMVAPSDMMDGRIGIVRKALDKEGFINTPILSYAAKYCSCFYSPFRDAAHSAPAFGDRKTYQMDPANISEAIREVRLDIEEGADIVIVKPALAYLDVIKTVKETFMHPTAAYNVSGEYSIIKAAAARGWIDEKAAQTEVLLSIKRAGADIIISYAAKDAAILLNGL
jgi:porphobilinogen synthase